MHYFQYQDNELYCEQVPVNKIAEEVGSPVYIYSYKTLQQHLEAFHTAFAPIDHLICFAVKTNSNLAILNLLGK